MQRNLTPTEWEQYAKPVVRLGGGSYGEVLVYKIESPYKEQLQELNLCDENGLIAVKSVTTKEEEFYEALENESRVANHLLEEHLANNKNGIPNYNLAMGIKVDGEPYLLSKLEGDKYYLPEVLQYINSNLSEDLTINRHNIEAIVAENVENKKPIEGPVHVFITRLARENPDNPNLDIILMQLRSEAYESVKHLRNAGIVHADIAGRNTFMQRPNPKDIDSNGNQIRFRCTTGDYGLSELNDIFGMKIITSRMTAPIKWMPRAFLNERSIDPQTDLYSLRVAQLENLRAKNPTIGSTTPWDNEHPLITAQETQTKPQASRFEIEFSDLAPQNDDLAISSCRHYSELEIDPNQFPYHIEMDNFFFKQSNDHFFRLSLIKLSQQEIPTSDFILSINMLMQLPVSDMFQGSDVYKLCKQLINEKNPSVQEEIVMGISHESLARAADWIIELDFVDNLDMSDIRYIHSNIELKTKNDTKFILLNGNKDEKLATISHVIQTGNLPLMAYLLSDETCRSEIFNFKSKMGNNILDIAVMSERSDLLKLLIDNKFSLDKIKPEHREKFFELLSTDVDYFKKQSDKYLPDWLKNIQSRYLVRSAIEKDEPLGDLIKKIDDINYKDKNGNTLLHNAVNANKNLRTINLLIKNRARLDDGNNYGDTALHLAVRNENINAMKLLISNGADINKKNSNGDTALHLAAKKGNILAVKLLISKHALVNEKNESGETALHLAVNNGNVELVKLLISKGANINEKNNTDNTPLHLAVRLTENANSIEISKVLVNNGADLTIKNVQLRTPFAVAKLFGRDEFEKLLTPQPAPPAAKEIPKATFASPSIPPPFSYRPQDYFLRVSPEAKSRSLAFLYGINKKECFERINDPELDPREKADVIAIMIKSPDMQK